MAYETRIPSSSHTCYKTAPPWASASVQILTEKLKFNKPVENILYYEYQIRFIRKHKKKKKKKQFHCDE